MLLAPAIFGLFMTMPVLVELIPKYSKWAPALPLFYIFCVAAFFSSYSTPFMNLFNALGKVKISFAFMLFWTVTTWILTPFFTTMFGMIGFPITQLLLAVSSIMVIWRAKKLVKFRFIHSVNKPLFATAAMVLFIYTIMRIMPVTSISLGVSIIGGGVLYLGILLFVFRINPATELKSLFNNE